MSTKGGQAQENRSPQTAQCTILCGWRLLASENEAIGRWQAKGERGLGLVKTKHKENGSREFHLDSHMPFPVIRVPTTCIACRRWLRTKVDAFKNKP